MPGITRIVALLAVLVVLGCGSGKTGRKPGGGSSRVDRDLKTTKVGRSYVGKRVVVTAVDRTRLAQGAVAIRIRNETDEFLPDLGYEVTLYYENPDHSKRKSQPYLPETTKKRKLDLDSGEEATITVKPGELSPGAADVFLRLRAERPEATKVGDTFLSESVRVLKVERDWFSSSPKATFEIRNDWDNPLRLYYRVQLIKDGKPVGQTEWKKAPGVLRPGATMVLEADLRGKRVVGTYPSLKIRRANI
jgi:hypothetical protein